MKEIQFMDRIIEKIDEDIQDYEKEEIERPDKNPNKLIKKYQKWENFLIQEQEKRKDMVNDTIMEKRSQIQDGISFLYYIIIILIFRVAERRGFLYERNSE